MKPFLLRFAATAVLSLAMFALDGAASAASVRDNTYFIYGGRKVRVEMIRPAGAAQAPAALILHGASGVGRGWYIYPFAEAMAKQGVAAAVVHYYDGIRRRRGKASPDIFETRDRILRAAITHVLAQKGVRRDGVGIYGMSLGGFHALSLGVRDPRVKAVVSLAGALSGHIPPQQLRRMPPTLILHGSRDRVVPFDRALKVSRAMEAYGAPGDIKIYPGEGHSFTPKAHKDAVGLVARFLSRGLKTSRRLAENVAK